MTNADAKTNFQNKDGRVIYRGARGAFFVMKKDGTKKYSPKAAFRQVGNAPRTKITKANTNVPAALMRKVRKNAGVARGPRGPSEATLFRRIFNNKPARKPAVKKAGPAKRPGRKPTTAMGMMKAGMTPNAGDLTRMLFSNKPKAVRKPAVKKAGPAKRPGRKPTTARGMMKAGMSPNAGDLTRMLLANYNKPVKARKVRSNKGKARVAAPKSAMMKKPKALRPVLNLIVVSPGGTSTVMKRKAPKTAKGAMKAGMTPNSGDLTRMLLANYNKKPRKTRKNKGVKRGPRASKKVLNKNPFAALR